MTIPKGTIFVINCSQPDKGDVYISLESYNYSDKSYAQVVRVFSLQDRRVTTFGMGKNLRELQKV